MGKNDQAWGQLDNCDQEGQLLKGKEIDGFVLCLLLAYRMHGKKDLAGCMEASNTT